MFTDSRLCQRVLSDATMHVALHLAINDQSQPTPRPLGLPSLYKLCAVDALFQVAYILQYGTSFYHAVS